MSCPYKHLFSQAAEERYKANAPDEKKEEDNVSRDISKYLAEHDHSKTRILIGIAGKKFHGKSTLAKFVAQASGFHVKAFAEPLKQTLMAIFHLTRHDLYDEKSKEEPLENWFNLTPRDLMQKVGTDLFRDRLSEIFPEIGDRVWTLSFTDWYKKTEINLVIVEDIRFQNEVDCINSLGGHVIYVERPSVKDTKSDSHKSERLEIDKSTCFCVLQNDDTPEYLEKGLLICMGIMSKVIVESTPKSSETD